MEISENNFLEKSRTEWTTYTNLNMWFNTWEGVLIELGFARLKIEGEDCEGSILLFDGKKDIMINLDETDGSLNNTCGKRGGRPSFVFYSEYISGGASRSNKTYYSPIIIAGSSSAVDPLTLHFQLKTHDKSDTGHKFSIDLFLHAKDVVGKFGWTDRRPFLCTWFMNVKAGMDAVERDNYFVFLPIK